MKRLDNCDLPAAPTPAGSDDMDAFDNPGCRTCGESTDDGEGYDGECGNCADRTEAASQAAGHVTREKSDDHDR